MTSMPPNAPLRRTQDKRQTADRDYMAVVKEAIEDRGCHHGIAEHRTPVTDATIAG
jgi:hypothetical protein